jgi:hypothetical protein
MLPNFLFSTMKQKSLSCLCQVLAHRSNLHTGTNGVQLVKALKLNRAFLSDTESQKHAINKSTSNVQDNKR